MLRQKCSYRKGVETRRRSKSKKKNLKSDKNKQKASLFIYDDVSKNYQVLFKNFFAL